MAEWKVDDFTKSGFERLLNLFDDNTEDVVKITRAFGLAAKAHKGQEKKGAKTEPHINHSLRVALILAEELKMLDPDIVSGALLHDILETSSGTVKEDEVKEHCGEKVFSLVSAVTEPEAKMQDKERALREYFKNIEKQPKEARYLKLAERLDNIRLLKNAPQKEKMQRYKEETQQYVIPVAEKTDEKLVFKLSVALYELK